MTLNNHFRQLLPFRIFFSFTGMRIAKSGKVHRMPSAWPSVEAGSRMHKVAESVRSRHSHDGGVVLDIRQGQMFSLNYVGSTILELLKRGSCQSEIVDIVTSQFEISRDVAEADVREFIQALERHRLAEQVDRKV